MPDPYIHPMSALNQGSQLLADKGGPLDRFKWLRMGDIVRSAMAGGLAGVPGGPLAMGAAAAGAAADTAWDQMYPGAREGNITLAEIGGKRGAVPPVPEGMVRLYRGQKGELIPIPDEHAPWHPERGRWFSTDKEVADWYGDTYYVDVPEAVSHASMEPDALFNKTGRLIPAQYANQAKLHPVDMNKPVPVRDVARAIEGRYPGVKMDAYESGGVVRLGRIQVPAESQRQGVGTAAMRELLDHADANKMRVALSPTSEFGTSRAALEQWYRGMGFKPNKGRSIDHSVSETFIREPK